MSWTQVFMLSSLTTLLILTFSIVVESAAVWDNSKSDDPKGAARQVFMPESDASNFFKRHSRRSSRYHELQVEQRVTLVANKKRREYNEEQKEYEAYLEEIINEQNEGTRESNEHLREFHNDGLYSRN